MSAWLLTAALWLATVGSGLVAGVLFTFSTFVMRAFGALSTAEAVAAMQAVNKTILSSLFMPLFFGTSLASLGLGAWAVTHWNQPGMTLLLAACVLYFAGMFLCTAVFNVPLNEALDAVDARSARAAQVWTQYQTRWTAYNHVRTVAATAACVLFVLVLSQAPSP